MASYRVTGVQMSVSRKLSANLSKIIQHIEACKSDFILFPEMSLTGYHGEFSEKAARTAWDQIAEACRQNYVTAIVGTGCRENGHIYIQSRIFGDNGEVLGTHEKLVPTAEDREFCRPGEELRVFENGGLQFGCLICNDLWVAPGCGPYPDPRLCYQLGKKGAQAVFQSMHSGTESTYAPYHDSNLLLRARESGFYIFTSNAADAKAPLNAATGVISPQGEWVEKCPLRGEHTYTYDLVLEGD